MSSDISPPPAKRRKTIVGSATSVQTSPSVPRSLPQLEAKTMRIFSWNVNGISPFLQTPITSFFQASKSTQRDVQIKDAIPPASLRGFLHRHNWPTMLFLQEVKIAPHDVQTQDTVSAAVNSRLPLELTVETKGPTYKTHFTLPTDRSNARGLRGNGQVYGVCSIIRSDLCDQHNVNVRTVDWDQEGRISVVEVISDLVKLAAFNIYAVNGTGNPYRDANTGHIRGTRHDRKRQVHSLLSNECKQLEETGWDVLLTGDMNVAPDARDGFPKLRVYPREHIVNRSDFHEKLLNDKGDGKSSGFRGVDVWRKMHGEERRYTYFSRGRKWGTSADRVDYFVAGKKMWDRGCIKACGILDSEAERGPSDHVPIWADIELKVDETQGVKQVKPDDLDYVDGLETV